MNQALLTALEEVAARIPEIQANRQYWFIRTNGGLFYDDFLHTGSVGIGYNMVTWAQIRAAFAKNKDAEGGIVSAVVSRYPDFDKNQLGRVVGLFSRFYLDMQPGDVVVMPSGGSHEYAFGIVTDGEPFEVETTTIDDKSIYRKRRPVDWIVRKPWQSMDSNLYEAFRATQAMTTLNPYASFLDREMHSLYTKDGQTHVRLDITTTEEINGADYFSMGSALLNLCAWFADEAGLSLAESEIDVRQNIQSPGKLELIDLFLNSFFLLFQMPVPDAAGQGQEPVIERSGLIATGLGDAAQAFGPADGMFNFNAAAGVRRIFGSLGLGKGCVRTLFTASRLAVG